MRSAPYILAALASGARAQSRVCNNAAALCSRAYSNITHLGAHDSPFVRNETNGFTPFGDQFYGSIPQLNAGVRLLTAQIYNVSGVLTLCHSNCLFENVGPLTTWLTEIKAWMDGHPNDVVTILLVNAMDADAASIDADFSSSGIKEYGYAPSDATKSFSPWPTLDDMIDANKRLVTFIASLPPSSNNVAPYLLDQFTFVFENSYHNDNVSDFSCEVNRPSQLASEPTSQVLGDGYLPLMNHFLYDVPSGTTIETPAPEDANMTNSDNLSLPGNLGTSTNNCTAFYGGRPPTFILTDFFNVGDALDTIDRVNGVTGATSGRTNLPETEQESMADPVAPSPAVSSSESMATVGGVTGLASSSATVPSAQGSATSTSGGGAGGAGTMTTPATVASTQASQAGSAAAPSTTVSQGCAGSGIDVAGARILGGMERRISKFLHRTRAGSM